MAYVPFVPPNVGGFPKGRRLLGPGNLVHTFDLVAAAGMAPESRDGAGALATLGVFDVSATTLKVLDGSATRSSGSRLAVRVPRVRGHMSGPADLAATVPHRPRCRCDRRGRGGVRPDRVG